MARDGSGNYNLASGNPVATGDTITAALWNNTFNDLASAMTASIASDGQTSPSANLPMNGKKHTGVADGSAATDYAAYGQLPKRGPLCYKSGSASVADSALATISWDAQTGDTVSAWVISAPTRITVPAGYTKIRLCANLQIDGMTGAASNCMIPFWITRNGANWTGQPYTMATVYSSATTLAINLSSGWMTTSATNYFELNFINYTGHLVNYCNSGTQINRTWFFAEFLK